MVDILVVGGGIHGAAVARDAARRGLTVLLLERGDLASGTSSRTSKLIHGGIRYLETAQIGLVREALHERTRLLETAPEHVRPLPFLIPHYAREGRRRGVVSLGLALYAGLAGSERLAEHHQVSAAEAVAMVPGLRTEGLLGGSVYWDAQMDDAALCVAIALDAERWGARVRTYAELTAIARTVDDAAWRVHFRDTIDGVDGEEEARLVVNATGPWVDSVRALARGHVEPTVRRSRGTHVVVPMPVERALLLTARKDGRVFFVLPWGEHALIGTTDDDDPGEPGAALPRPEDVRYLLEEAARALPERLGDARPVRAFAGIRPLARGRADRSWENTREARIVVESGMRSIVGGKYTTHRSLAERVVDGAARSLGGRARPCDTRTAPVPGGRDAAIAALSREFPRRVATTGGFAVAEAEAVHAARAEKARRLDDVLLRRTRLWLDGRALREAAVPVAAWLAPVLGWSERRRTAEVDRLLAALDREERAIDAVRGDAEEATA
ncbi:MAG TPA: glycerol-3-phosphate dehydrogenase/oxidase [Candidatus Eisenbacteria bacterium]